MPAPLYPKPIRWWPAIAIGVLMLILLSAIWIPERPNRQMQVMPTILVCSIGYLLLCLWFFAFSRANRKIRLRGLGILILLIILAVSLFQNSRFYGRFGAQDRMALVFCYSDIHSGTIFRRSRYRLSPIFGTTPQRRPRRNKTGIRLGSTSPQITLARTRW